MMGVRNRMIQRGMLPDEDSPLQKLADVTLVEDSIKRYGKGLFLLIGRDGNAHFIIARVNKALKERGWSERALRAVRLRMMAGDYDHLLQVAMDLQDPRAYELEGLAADLEEKQRALEEEMRLELQDEEE